MKILGIETSCDETAASIVKDGWQVLSQVVATSLKDHQKYGGIIPEIASRRQMELIQVVVPEALKKSGASLAGIDCVAVTQSPGLIGSLLVGVAYARALSFALAKPLIEVDHIEAHLYANFLDRKPAARFFPAVGLVVSGGHTSLYYVKNFTDYKILGQTRDDAAGEAFDKVARILELGYPGGPIIDRLARRGKNSEIRFSCAELADSFEFSFSGIKTAVLHYKQRHEKLPTFSVQKIAYAFQDSLVAVLVKKSIAACLKKKVKTLLIGGGVAANSALRERLPRAAARHDIKVFFPPPPFCLDNAAMIAGLGYHLSQKSSRSKLG